MDTSKATVRPWRTERLSDGELRIVAEGGCRKIAVMPWTASDLADEWYDADLANQALIVEAVNSYDRTREALRMVADELAAADEININDFTNAQVVTLNFHATNAYNIARAALEATNG